MMHGEDEQMFQGREAHEPRAHERTGPKIKRTFRLLPHQMGWKISGAGPGKSLASNIGRSSTRLGAIS